MAIILIGVRVGFRVNSMVTLTLSVLLLESSPIHPNKPKWFLIRRDSLWNPLDTQRL